MKMDINTYSALAMRTAGDKDPLMNGLLGLAGETGELIDVMKKVIFHGKPLDRDKVVAEAGDVIWYINLILCSMGITWEEALEANIRKLEARYPDLRFDAERANNRNLDAEHRAMKG